MAHILQLLLLITVLLAQGVSVNAGEKPQAALLAVSGQTVPHPFGNMSPEEMRERMRQSQRDNIKYQLEAYSEEESIHHIATFIRGLFEALVAEGFSEEQAIEIVSAIGLPSRR